MYALGRAGFADVLLEIRNRILAVTGMDPSRVAVVVDPASVPHTAADRDILIHPRAEKVAPGIDGGGRYVNHRSRRVDLVLRSRRYLDRPGADLVHLGDDSLGHLAFEDRLVDGLELWSPVASGDETAMLALPVAIQKVTAPQRDGADPGWISSELEAEVHYLRYLSLPERTLPPTATGEESMDRADFRVILRSLLARLSEEAQVDPSRLLVTAGKAKDIKHYGVRQDILVLLGDESADLCIEGGGRYANLRHRQLTLVPRSSSRLDRTGSDLVRLTDESMGHFALEDRICDAVELWLALDAEANGLALPAIVGGLDAPQRDQGDSAWLSSQMDVSIGYLRNLTLPEI